MDDRKRKDKTETSHLQERRSEAAKHKYCSEQLRAQGRGGRSENARETE